jgi:hypothetical protein
MDTSYSVLTNNIEADTGTLPPRAARRRKHGQRFPNSLNLSLRVRGINRQWKQLTSSNCDDHGVLGGRQHRGWRVKKAVSKRYGIE